MATLSSAFAVDVEFDTGFAVLRCSEKFECVDVSLDYFTYSDLIFEHFFNPQRSGQATMLAFDEDEARRLGDSIGEPAETFARKVTTSVGEIFRENRGFGWWRKRSPRERAGLLACSVLIMSSLNVDDEAGFYKNYYRDVLGLDSASRSQEYAIHSQWWEDLRKYLNVDRGGELGRIVFLDVVKYKNLNYPASQSILRGVDRRWLWDFYTRFILDPTVKLSRERFLATWRPGSAGETVGIERMGKKLTDGDESAPLVWEIFYGEYEAWRNDPVQQEKIARRRIRRESRPAAKPSGKLAVAESSRFQAEFETATRVRTRYSLYRPMFPTDRPFVLRLEVYPSQFVDLGLPELDDGWVRVPNYEVSASQFNSGFKFALQSLPLRVAATNVACFCDDATGLRSVDTFPPGQRVTLLYDEEIAPDLEQFVETHLYDRVDVRLDELLAGLQAISGNLDPTIIESDLPPVLREIFANSSVELSFRLGLRLRDGSYLEGGPPMLRFMHAVRATAQLFVDGMESGLVQRGLNFLPPDLAPGLHVVKVLDRSVNFRIAFPDEVEAQTYDLQDNDFGFIARLRPPLVRSSSSAISMQRAELEGMNAVVIQGADLMLPYDRTA